MRHQIDAGYDKNSNISKLAVYLEPIILGMDDALVEMTGALAGFSIALSNNRLIALAGLTTGIAATLSMTASEFLSKEAANQTRKSWIAAFCCGMSYLFTVALLLSPFFFLKTPFTALCVCLLFAALIIFIFTFVVARFRKTNFFFTFIRMLGISFGVAVCAFFVTWLARSLWGIEV